MGCNPGPHRGDPSDPDRPQLDSGPGTAPLVFVPRDGTPRSVLELGPKALKLALCADWHDQIAEQLAKARNLGRISDALFYKPL